MVALRVELLDGVKNVVAACNRAILTCRSGIGIRACGPGGCNVQIEDMITGRQVTALIRQGDRHEAAGALDLAAREFRGSGRTRQRRQRRCARVRPRDRRPVTPYLSDADLDDGTAGGGTGGKRTDFAALTPSMSRSLVDMEPRSSLETKNSVRAAPSSPARRRRKSSAIFARASDRVDSPHARGLRCSTKSRRRSDRLCRRALFLAAIAVVASYGRRAGRPTSIRSGRLETSSPGPATRRAVPMDPERHVRLFKNGHNQALRIPAICNCQVGRRFCARRGIAWWWNRWPSLRC